MFLFCIFVVFSAHSLQSPNTNSNSSEFVSWKRNLPSLSNLGPKYSFTSYLTAWTTFFRSSNRRRLLMPQKVDSFPWHYISTYCFLSRLILIIFFTFHTGKDLQNQKLWSNPFCNEDNCSTFMLPVEDTSLGHYDNFVVHNSLNYINTLYSSYFWMFKMHLLQD